jgi:hypothetical protein
MSYSEVFGGGTINPSQRTFLNLVSAVDVTLEWPLNAVAGDNVAADIINADMTAPGLNINLSDARQVSNGFTSLIVNIGSQDFTVRDALGGTIVSPISAVGGTAWFIYLEDNSTEDGTWQTFQLGATVSVADAGALAGAGIKAISTSLNQRIVPTLTSATPITWVDADRAQFTIWGGGVGVLDLPAPGTVGADWFSMIRNEGTGILTVTPPSGLIDSAATLIMNPGDSAFIVTNGTDFFTIGLGGSTVVGFDFVQIDISGSGDFILTGVQLNRISYEFVGLLTGTRKVVVPNTIQQYWIGNFTTGAFTFEIATAAQVTPIQIIQNNRSILYCDGTDVVDAETGTLTPPITIGQGGTSATDAATALANLGGISDTREVNTQLLSGLGGGGDLSTNRDLVLDVDNLTVELTIDLSADVLAFYDDDAGAMRKTPLSNIAAITIEEEGAPLATLANTLNFTGGIVTASGAGATKTIDIPIEASTVFGRMLRGDGAGGWEEWNGARLTTTPTELRVDGATIVATPNLTIETSTNNYGWFSGFSNIVSFSGVGTVDTFNLSGFDTIEFDGPSLKLWEQGSAPGANEASYAQLYLRTDPSYPYLMLQQDDGNEVPICEQGTFTLDWDDGFSDASNVNNYFYTRIGNFVHAVQIGSNLGNSNANNCGTSTGVPVALRPTTNRWCGVGSFVDNASIISLCQLRLNTDGTMDAYILDGTSDPGEWGNFWTTSGVKGPNAGTSFSWLIEDA